MMVSMDIFWTVALGLIGLCLGSFAGASVWRIRARQLVADKKAGEKVDAKEWKKLKTLSKKSVATDRSVCLHCGYTLRWYDLIPLVSWLSLKGKCRHCHRSIGTFEPLIEVGTALFFVASYLLWPESLDSVATVVPFVLWLLSGVGLAILFAYDAKWFLLPDVITYSVIGVAVISVIFQAIQSDEPVSVLLNAAGAVAILSGLYLLIYVLSKGRWIGFGDVKLGIALGLLLADWQLAFVALFLANLVGCFIVIPGMLLGKLTRTSYVPFGPLLIVGMVLAQFFGAYAINLLLFPIY
jgi:prepilin signal peptidase PulO-like enzyme (type II secretory pathway)